MGKLERCPIQRPGGREIKKQVSRNILEPGGLVVNSISFTTVILTPIFCLCICVVSGGCSCVTSVESITAPGGQATIALEIGEEQR